MLILGIIYAIIENVNMLEKSGCNQRYKGGYYGNFMKLRNSGKTINEIAKIYDVTRQSIYLHLQEIADENHVSRDELLSRERNQHSKKNEFQQEKEILSTENLKKYFLGMLKNVDGIILAIDDALKMEELK